MSPSIMVQSPLPSCQLLCTILPLSPPPPSVSWTVICPFIQLRDTGVCVCVCVSPLNCGISPVGLLGKPLWQASLVRATVTSQLPSRKPICWLPASCRHRRHHQAPTSKGSKGQRPLSGSLVIWLTFLVSGTSMGTGTTSASKQP